VLAAAPVSAGCKATDVLRLQWSVTNTSSSATATTTAIAAAAPLEGHHYSLLPLSAVYQAADSAAYEPCIGPCCLAHHVQLQLRHSGCHKAALIADKGCAVINTAAAAADAAVGCCAVVCTCCACMMVQRAYACSAVR
jgi:hypothetical protein